jgi:hypothetical protein
VSPAGGGNKVSSRYLITKTVVVDRLEAYCDGLGAGTGSSSIQLAIFSNSSSVPNARLVQTVDGQITVADGAAAAWVGVDISALTLTATAWYWFAAIASTTRVRLYQDPGVFGDEKYNADAYPDMTDPFGGASTDQGLQSIRARVLEISPSVAWLTA